MQERVRVQIIWKAEGATANRKFCIGSRLNFRRGRINSPPSFSSTRRSSRRSLGRRCGPVGVSRSGVQEGTVAQNKNACEPGGLKRTTPMFMPMIQIAVARSPRNTPFLTNNLIQSV